MKLSIALLSLASSTNGVLLGRAVQDILSQISTINTNTQALVSAINNFNGQIANAVPVTTAESTLDSSIKQGTTAAKGTTTLSESDGTSVLNAIGSLIPNVLSAANAFVAKDNSFKTAGLGEIASNDLATLQTDSASFASALIAIAPTGLQAVATSASQCIDAAFSSAAAGSSASSCGVSITSSGATPAGTSSGTVSSMTSASSSSDGTSTTATSSPSASSSSSHSGSNSLIESRGKFLGAMAAIVIGLVL